MKVFFVMLLAFWTFHVHAEYMYVSVNSNDARFKVEGTEELIDREPWGMKPLGFTYRIDSKVFDSAKGDDWVFASEDYLKIQRKYLTPVADFTVADSNQYMKGCYFFTVGGEGLGYYMQPLPDGGVLFRGDYDPYTNNSIQWPEVSKRTYGTLLVKDRMAIFRDGFGQVVAYSSIGSNNQLISFESDEPTEFYYKLKCHKKFGFEEDLRPYGK